MCDDCTKPFCKEIFINGLPKLFAHKIRDVLSQPTWTIEYDNLTYGDIISVIQKEGLRMCIDMKLSKQTARDKKNAKYEIGTFCEQYGLPSIAPSRRKHYKKNKHITKPYKKHYRKSYRNKDKDNYYNNPKKKYSKKKIF